MSDGKRWLPDVTLVTVDGVDPELSLRALRYCEREIVFGDVKLVSFRCPEGARPHPIGVYCPIERLDYRGYNEFVAKRLVGYVRTARALVVQTDGFVTNPAAWDPRFLDYDYVGAPWPTWSPWARSRVGNGGFSLRSRHFLEVGAEIEYGGENEDYELLCKNLDLLRARGVRIAPVELAARFSSELDPCDVPGWDPAKSFGFHGRHHSDLIARLGAP